MGGTEMAERKLSLYNEHLVRDYGALNSALGVLLVAAVFLERRLSQASLVAWLAYVVSHSAFHNKTEGLVREYGHRRRARWR